MNTNDPPDTASEVVRRITAIFAKGRAQTAAFEEELAPQMDALDQAKFCPQHPDTRMFLDREETVWRSWHHQAFRAVYAPCVRCEAEARDSQERAYWRKRGVPDRLLHAAFENFEIRDAVCAEALTRVRDFVDRARLPVNAAESLARMRGGFLILLGTEGMGKGHLAVAAAKALGKGGEYITHPDLLDDLRASYSTGEKAVFLERYQEAPCLILDEFGLSAGGKDEGPVLYQILAHRHDRRLPTIIASNEELPTIQKGLGLRLLDRVREDCRVVNIFGESFRRRLMAA